jgi:multidrug efflux pump subunit AcrA (membrane-fusion protein)
LQADITGVPLDASSYWEQRENLSTQLETLRIQDEYLKFEEERRVLRAPMDGVVTSVINFTEGMRTTADQRIATVADQTLSVFFVRGPDAAFIDIGEFHQMTIRREPYLGEVVDPEVIGVDRFGSDEGKYLIVRDGDQSAFTSRDYATIRITLQVAEDTLYVPFTAVKRANARIFTYVLQDGLRTIRDVEIGLEGNTTVEIVKGLSAGETVILD